MHGLRRDPVLVEADGGGWRRERKMRRPSMWDGSPAGDVWMWEGGESGSSWQCGGHAARLVSL